MIARMEEGKVLVPWNFSENSMHALRAALASVGDASQIRVIHVAASHSSPGPAVLYESTEKQQTEELRQRFYEQIRPYKEFQDVLFHVSYGPVAPELVRFSTIYKTRLIVMASRELKGLSRFWFHRMPEKIIRLAKCPVLVVLGTKASEFSSRTRFPSIARGTNPKKMTAMSYRHGM